MVVIACIAMVPAIALTDWQIFSSKDSKNKWRFIPAAFMESTMFILGIFVGLLISLTYY